MNDSKRGRYPSWLGRVLGPVEPELTCPECFEQLDRYVELELSGRDMDALVPGMRAHFEGCAACREEHESLVALLKSETAPKSDNH